MISEREPEDILLAMETSGDVCGVAVLRNGVFIAEHTFRHGMHLSERLMGHVDAVLHEADTTLADVSAFAVGIGPGSFTGTRIGVMTIKTLAAVLEKPVIGIGSLDVMAAEYRGLQGALVVPLLPCRTGVVYACPFSVEAAAPLALAEATAFPLSELTDLLKALEPQSVLLCGLASGRYRPELTDLLREAAFPVSYGSVTFPRASHVAQLTYLRRQSDVPFDDAMSLVPLYISPPPISQPKQAIPQPTEN